MRSSVAADSPATQKLGAQNSNSPNYTSPRRNNSLLASLAASAATISAATSFTPMIANWSWLAHIACVTILIVGTGFVLRFRIGPGVVLLAQAIVFSGFLIGRFTNHGFLGVFPTPTALVELNNLFTTAFTEIRVGLPPIDDSTAIVALMTVALGITAILVDCLAVGLRAPAATGLVLLCIYAVPASLSDMMLPWWTFVLGAATFSVLLLTARQSDDLPTPTDDRPRDKRTVTATSMVGPISVVASALVLALIAGNTITSVDTVGRLPGGNQSGQNSTTIGGLGLDPLTSLRGLLNQRSDTELFRVQGLEEEKQLLRAFTLDDYRPNAGWQLSDRPLVAANPANQPLPLAPGDDGSASSQEIRIEPINWVDLWLPVYGSPRSLSNVAADWFYDAERGAIFTEKRQKPPAYTELASLAEPAKQDLQAVVTSSSDVPAQYTTIDFIDPRVVALANDITQDSATQFDKAAALWAFFTTQGGFTYDTQTAPATDADALADFLLNGKRGFCSQFASAMAVMLRTLGIPARVAVGFTEGTVNGDYRTITSRDAHAWVEAYFGAHGWVSFDPTPRSDGRNYSPEYLQNSPTTPPTNAPSPSIQPPTSANPEQPNAVQPADGESSTNDTSTQNSPVLPGWVWWLGISLVILLILALSPMIIRNLNRRTRTRLVHDHAGNAAEAAWRELVAESTDRGKPIDAATLRTEAEQLTEHYHLSQQNRDNVNIVITELERSWYGPEVASKNTTEDAIHAASVGSAIIQLNQRIRQEPLTLRSRLLPQSMLQTRPAEKRGRRKR